MRRTARVLVAAAVAAGVMAPVAASAFTIVAFRNPANGCTYRAYGPDVTVSTLPTPGVTKTGGTGAAVDCP